MKLDKLQRYTAYCIMLAELKDRENCIDYLCECAEDLFTHGSTMWYEEGFEFIKEYLPELFKHNKHNKECGDTWFKSLNERIEALNQCILETHPDL